LYGESTMLLLGAPLANEDPFFLAEGVGTSEGW
jgi:hypothetical protein